MITNKAMKTGNPKLMAMMLIAVWVNLAFKVICTFILGSVDDLQGHCFLEKGFKTWTMGVGVGESIFFILVNLRIKAAADHIQQRNY